MFTSYIKNLNDMVFSTSESPEEQPSTGVLGRIGSWFSPWRGRGPKSPTENASTTGDQALKSEGEEESGEPVSSETRGRQREEEEEQEQSSGPDPLGLDTQIFPCEEEDATQSAHRDGSVASSTEAAGGGPREEESAGSRKDRIGQGEEREESSNGTSASGNSERNVSHLTHLSSEQGVEWDSDQAQRQKHAQTGRRRLHVYLEETSVIQRGQDTCAGQEVVRTKYKTDLQVIPKAKSSQSNAENKKTHVRPVAGTESYYSALVGVSLKSRKDSEVEPEPDNDQTEPDSMGRKNSAKRKIRKNSQGDGGPQEKVTPNAEPHSEGFPPSDKAATSPQGKSPNTHTGESSVNSSPKHDATSQPSPEAGEGKTSCPDSVEKLDNVQVAAATPACAVDGAANMEEDDSLYKVERKTETPESKRRSIKVSRSEVKLFTKNVPLNQKKSPTGDTQDFKSPLKTIKDEEKDKPSTETDSRLNNLKKIDEEPKAVIGRIADKISLFERPAGGVNKSTLRTPRSADVSPVRGATDRLKEVFVLSEQRSRSAERYVKGRSGSASPAREKPLTIKERVQNLTEASKTDSRPPKPPKPATTGMSQKSTSSVAVTASMSPELDNQGKLDTKELIQTNAVSEVTLKPDGLDASAVGGEISLPKEQVTDTKTKDVLSKTADRGTKPNSVETDAQPKGPGDSPELTDNISPQSKAPSRTGSRSKRRKGKEPSSPINPSNENKSDCTANKQEVAIRKQQRGDDAAQNNSVSKTLSERVPSPSDKVQGTPSGKESLSDTKQKAVKRDLKAVDAQKKQSDTSSKKENIDKQKKPEPSVSKDEPDTVANSGTKAPIDKDPVVVAQKEEKVGGLFTEEKGNAAKESKETPASSPSPVVEKTPSKEQEPPVKHRKLDKELPVKSEPKSKGKVREPVKKGQTPQSQRKDPEPINDVEELKKTESVKTNQTEKKDKEKEQRLLHSVESVTKAGASDGGDAVSGKQGSVVGDDERGNSEREKTGQTADKTKPVTRQHETASESSAGPPATTSQPKKAGAGVYEAGSGAESDKEPLKAAAAAAVAAAASVPTVQQTASAEKPGTDTQTPVTAAKPLPDSVCVEKTENPPDDSCTHGANAAVFSSAEPITKATTASEEVTVKATNSTPALISAQTDSMAEKESSGKASSPVSAPKPVNSEQVDVKKSVKSGPSDVKKTGDAIKITPRQPQCEASKNTQSASDISSVKDKDKGAQRPTGIAASISSVKAEDKTAGKTSRSPTKERSPVANGDISPPPQPRAVNEEPVGAEFKPHAIPKTKSLNSDPIQRPALKKLQLPRGLSKDDSSPHQDAPSSWLDVDFPKRKLKLPVPKLSSSGSESNLLDTSGDLDDDDFIEKIKNLCAPFSLPPRKHNPLRPSQPPFAMPAIKEDRFEKTFDPEEFKFGLRKKNKFTVDSAPSILAKRQSAEAKSGLKPARASLADRSMLLSSLDSHSRLRDKTLLKDEEDPPEEKDDQIKVKSRLEGSCVLNSLTSSILKGKRNGIKMQAEEGTDSSDVSPSDAPQPSPPPPAPPKDTLARQSPAPSNGEEARASEAAVGDSGPPLPSFNDIKLPDYLEKYLPREPAKPVQSTQGQERVMTEVVGQTMAPAPGDEVDVDMKPAPVLPDAAPPSFPGIPPPAHSALPDLKKPPAQPQRTPLNTIRAAKGFHKRPGKMVLFEKALFSGQVYEVYRDVADATSFQLSPLISVKVVRGCWVLYEKPDFQGRCIALEEGGIELTNVWAEPGPQEEPSTGPPMQIGSIRLAVGDYSVPRIDLFTEPEGRGRVTPYHDDTIETGSFGIPLSTASIQVHSGVWLVFSDPGFQGMLAVLETGVYPFPETWGFPSPFVGSLRPLKMGGFKVENPSEVKALVYEKPGFEGRCLEIDNDVFCFCESEEGISAGGADLDSNNLKSVGSLKIIGGLWVGYSEPGFEGQQHILEEGEYLDCRDWGGSEQLLSLRPVLADFLAPHLKMFSDRDFGELGVNIDITVPIINMDETGYGTKTQSIDVIGGVWVVFEEPGFCGEPYVLEKGLYGSPEDWGALQPRVGSAMPVVLDDFENAAKFKVQLFSEPGFQGSALVLEDSVASLQDGFPVASCKILAGSWLAFEGLDFSGRMYVLEVGSYPDLRAMGCFHPGSSILSLQTVGFEFSLPSITLFERGGLRGKRVILTDGSVNLQLTGGCSRVQSVLVEGGMWVLYEGINYRGAQILLKPGQVHDWHKLSGWLKIGSLRPLIQKQVHFRLRNRQTGLMMSVTGDLDDVKLLRIQETEETGGFEQIWSFQNGHLHCKLLEECCLGPSGSVTMAGSRLGLTPEQGNEAHLWSITPKGFICYSPTPDLVLEVKGGLHYDKNQVILNTLDPNKLQQRWNLEII